MAIILLLEGKPLCNPFPSSILLKKENLKKTKNSIKQKRHAS